MGGRFLRHDKRQHLITLRDALPQGTRLSGASSAATAAWPLLSEVLKCPSVVAVYSATGSELDPTPLAATLRGRGHTLAFPRVMPHKHLEFAIATPSQLIPGPFNILEPNATCPIAPLHDIRVFLVPGLGFTRSGERLGWGHGYYDRCLAQHPQALRVGYCFAAQIVDSVAATSIDQPMDCIVTESAVIDCPKRPGIATTSPRQVDSCRNPF